MALRRIPWLAVKKMWNLLKAEGASSNPLESISASSVRRYLTPDPCPRFGWVVAIQSDQTNGELTGKLEVSYPGAGTTIKTAVENFNIKDIDVFFVPYPHIELSLSASGGSASAQVNFYPINSAESALCFQSILTYWEANQIDAATTETLTPPTGATSFFPAVNYEQGFNIGVQDASGNVLYQFALGNDSITEFPQSSGQQFFPLKSGATIVAENPGGDAAVITIIYRYDFNEVGGA